MFSSRSAEYIALNSISSASTIEKQHIKAAKALPALVPHARLARHIQKFYRRLTRPWWAWEIFAATVSIAATISLVIVLSQADKQKQQSWAIGGTLLTINTIVAGIGTALRTTLLLVVAGALNQSAWNWFASSVDGHESDGRPLKDLETFSDASANSWNCIKLLWRTKCRYLVTIGAFVMILSLAFDAFLQQILSIEQHPQQVMLSGSNLTANSVLPRSTTYRKSSILTIHDDIDGYTAGSVEETYWSSMMTAALFENAKPLPNANCPTGSCTWPTTPSLATCHECKYVDVAVSQNSNATCSNITTYSLPHQPEHNITISQCDNESGATGWQMISELSWDSDTLASGGFLPISPPANTTVVKVYSFGTPTTLEQAIFDQSLPWGFVAYECSISLCVRGYTGFLSDGSYYMSMIEDIGREAQYVDDGTGSLVWKFIDIPATLNVLESNTMTFDPQVQMILGYAASKVFTANTTISIGKNGIKEAISGRMGALLYESSNSLANLTTAIGKVSDSITNFIRATSHEELSTLHAPRVTASVPVIVVRWPWLTYVLVLQFSGLLFLLMTIRATNRRQVRAWKGHRTALLLAELDPNLQCKAQGGLSHRTGLDDRIGETKVRLEFDGDNRIAFRCVNEELSH